MVAYLSKGTDEAGEAHNTSISKQLGHLSNTADILLSVFRREAEVLVETSTDIVSIQAICRDALAD